MIACSFAFCFFLPEEKTLQKRWLLKLQENLEWKSENVPWQVKGTNEIAELLGAEPVIIDASESGFCSNYMHVFYFNFKYAHIF